VECRFVCSAGYIWEASLSACVSSTKLWSASDDVWAWALAADSSGNVFVTGYTKGAFTGCTNAGREDAFLTKWNADGTLAWTKQWGTDLIDEAYSVTVDSSDNIYVAGVYEKEGDNSDGEIFLTKFNGDGTEIWHKQWGTYKLDKGLSVAVESSGSIFVTGHTAAGLDGNTSSGLYDVFLTKLNPDSTTAWTKQWGSNDNDYGDSVNIDSNGNIFVFGYTYGAIDGNTSLGDKDLFVTKWNPDGTKAWTTQWGTDTQEYARSAELDSYGNLIVTGYTAGSFDGNTYAGSWDIFISRINADGTEAWTTQWGTESADFADSVTLDSGDNIYVAGYTNGSFNGSPVFGGYDIILSKLNPDGTLEWTDQWGTEGTEQGRGVTIFDEYLFITGWYYDVDIQKAYLTKYKL
jgi:uncharacterized delta-60 repeat protein